MNTLQLIGLNPADLIFEIKESLIPELTENLTKNFQPKEPTEFLTRAEICTLLKIDLSTLHRWRANGTIPSYGLGNRVYFKRSEVEGIINKNQLS